jgi:hypothetical protein
MIDFFKAGGFIMFVLVAVGLPLLAVAARFARNADPQRLSLIRALTSALAFAAIAGIASDVMAVCHYVARTPDALARPLPILLTGLAESLTPAILAGAIASIAWILVGVGVRRMPPA